MKSLNFWIIVLSLLLTISCSTDDGLITNDSDIENVDESENTPTLIAIENNNRQTLQSSVIVKVVDEEGNLVEGALVKILDTEVYTENGFAKLFNVLVNEDFTGVTISKSGYSTAVKSFTVSETHSNLLEVTLFEAQALTFNASEGTTLNFDENVSLDFPEDSLLNEDGSNFTGTAQVRLQYHEPNQVDYAESLPGTLVGLDTNGDYNALATEGMISIDLTDTSGNPLQIKDGESVNVRMPASVDAPDSILLWHLNEETGIWEEEGTATKNGSYYEFEVSHFSVYNLDYFIDAVDYIDFTVKSDSDILSNQKLIVYFEGSPIQEVVTDALGQFSLLYAPIGSYYIKPLLCDGDVQSETLNITSTGEVEVEIPIFSDYIEQTVVIIGYLKNCSYNFDETNPIIFTLFEGTPSEQSFSYIHRNSSTSFYIEKIGCGINLMNDISVTVNYSEENFNETYSFSNVWENAYRLNDTINFCDLSYFDGEPIVISDDLYDNIKVFLQLDDDQVITSELAFKIENLNYYSYSNSGINVDFDLDELIMYFPNLKVLSVNGNIVNIENLEQLEKLEDFVWYSDNISLSVLSDLPKIKDLTLRTSIELTDLNSIGVLPTLEYISIRNNAFTEEEIAIFQANHPNCEVNF